MKKRMISMLLALAMTASLAVGCGSKSNSDSSDADKSAKETTAETTETKEEVKSVFTKAPTGKTESGVVTYNIDMTQYEDGKKVRVWLPVAQDTDYQTIKDVTYDVNGAEGKLTEDELGNKMLYIEWDEETAAADRTASCSFHVTREEILRPEFKEEGEPGSDLDEYLQPSSTIPVDGVVKETADQITEGKDTYLDKARAIYDWIIANMNRDESVTGCGKGDVCALLDTKGGKCTDINSVFVGLCRASGIPAREMFGVRINDTDITKNQHCWAEFYLPGYGWVAADPADVLKAVLKNSWDKESAEAKEMQEYYWGSNDEKRVELSEGRDLTLEPAQDGEKLNNFGYPYAEVDGTAVDYYTPDQFVYTISFAEDAQ